MLHLDELFDDAESIATMDGDEYRTASVVLCRRADGAIESYCPAADWPSSPAGKLAQRDATITELSARITELEAQLVQQRADTRTHTQALDTPPERRSCPDCGQEFHYPQGLASHRLRKHGYRRPLDGDAVPSPSTRAMNDGEWACADCDSNTFSRSLTHPAYCMRCATKHESSSLAA